MTNDKEAPQGSELSDAELDTLSLYAEDAPPLGRELIRRVVAEVRRLREELRDARRGFVDTAVSLEAAVRKANAAETELTRLRSDEWLERAAQDILDEGAAEQWGAIEPMVELLRRHRDRKL